MNNLSINDIINNAVDELYRAKERLEELGEFDNDGRITPDQELISDIDASIERLQTIDKTIMVALLAAIYAGNIEERGNGFINDFGADSLAHREEYLKIAENYELPYNDDGLIATDVVYDDICEIMLEKYTEN